MNTRTSDNWKCLPGNFDTHNLFEVFDSLNSFGIPEMLPNNEYVIPDNLIPYNIRVRSHIGYKGLGIHFFLDDYRFEQTWIRPESGIERIKAAEITLTPDFSLYTDMPKAVQIYNTYRSRWVGRFWQQHHANVIPTVSWSDRESYEFCFLGIPEGMPVAVSTVSVDDEIKSAFLEGFAEAVARINPEIVLCYGKVLPEMHAICDNIKSYSPSFIGLRNIRKKTTHDHDNVIHVV